MVNLIIKRYIILIITGGGGIFENWCTGFATTVVYCVVTWVGSSSDSVVSGTVDVDEVVWAG